MNNFIIFPLHENPFPVREFSVPYQGYEYPACTGWPKRYAPPSVVQAHFPTLLAGFQWFKLIIFLITKSRETRLNHGEGSVSFAPHCTLEKKQRDRKGRSEKFRVYFFPSYVQNFRSNVTHSRVLIRVRVYLQTLNFLLDRV